MQANSNAFHPATPMAAAPRAEQAILAGATLRAMHRVKLNGGDQTASILYPSQRIAGMPLLMAVPQAESSSAEPSGGQAHPGSLASDVAERLAAAWNLASNLDLNTLKSLSNMGLTAQQLLTELCQARDTLDRLQQAAKSRLERQGDDFIDSSIMDLCADTLAETTPAESILRGDAEPGALAALQSQGTMSRAGASASVVRPPAEAAPVATYRAVSTPRTR